MQHVASVLVCLTLLVGSGGYALASGSSAAAVPTVTWVDLPYGPVGGGTVVTLEGTGFTGTTAVDFGATPATAFTVVSDSEITATSPAGTGTVNVTVTNADGTSAADDDSRFFYGASPAHTETNSTSTSTTPLFVFSDATYSVAEDAGTLTVTVAAAEPSSSTPCTVAYATSDGTAIAGTHYTAVSGLLDFSGGDETLTFDVPILADGVITGDQTLTLTLSSPDCVRVTEQETMDVFLLIDVLVVVNRNINTNTDTATLGSPSTAVVTIVNADEPLPLMVSPATLPAVTAGMPFSLQLEIDGGVPPYSCEVTAGALPAGLTLDDECLLSGTPTSPGDYTFTITVTDSADAGTFGTAAMFATATFTFSGTVAAAVPSMPAVALGMLAILFFLVARQRL